MGRIKTQLIKRTSRELMNAYSGSFSASFDENKTVVHQIAEIPSKKMRNSITGYITRLARKRQTE
jgi:small subunit ribosomal protein S17e